ADLANSFASQEEHQNLSQRHNLHRLIQPEQAQKMSREQQHRSVIELSDLRAYGLRMSTNASKQKVTTNPSSISAAAGTKAYQMPKSTVQGKAAANKNVTECITSTDVRN